MNERQLPIPSMLNPKPAQGRKPIKHMTREELEAEVCGLRAYIEFIKTRRKKDN